MTTKQQLSIFDAIDAHDAKARSSFADPTVRAEIDAALRAGIRYFASGSNHPGEIVGLARVGIDVGVAIHELHSAGENAIVEAVQLGARVFVDSGAFSEIGFGPTGPFVAKRIADKEWRSRLSAYVRLAARCGSSLFVVAPDMVAFQAETLERMERFGSYVRDAAAHGANVLVPVQKGAMPMAAFWARACEVLGVSSARLVAAIPMKKDATSTAELVTFLETARPARVHLLGLGPKSPRFAEVVKAARRACPGVELFCDSVLITSLVGRTNGRGGAPRPLTAALDAVSAELDEAIFTGDTADLDWTEAASCPSCWLTEAGIRRFASMLDLAGDDLARCVVDVDAWLQLDDRYLDPRVEGVLGTLWAEYVRGAGSTTWRKRESIVRLFAV